jgi:hypothetical protein
MKSQKLDYLKESVYDKIHETVWEYIIEHLGEPYGERLGDYHTIHGDLMARMVKRINDEMQSILKTEV